MLVSLKSFKKTVLIALTVSLLFSLLLIPDYTIAYALTYDNNKVGVVEKVNLKSIENKLNKRIKNGKVNIEDKLKISTVISSTAKFNSNSSISQNIIDTDKKIEEEYGLYIGKKIYYVGKSRVDILNLIQKIISQKVTGDNTYIMSEYRIVKGIYLDKKYSVKKLKKALNVIETREVKQTVTKTEKFKTKTIVDYTRIGNDEKIITKGQNGIYKITYLKKYVNKKLVSKTIETKKTLQKNITQVINVPFKKGDASNLTKGLSNSQKDFVNEILPQALKLYKTDKILPSLTLAQAALESGWGKYSIGKNIFGVKAYSDWKGKKSLVWTTEQKKDGSYEKIKCWFKNYDSFGESVKDYGELLSLSRYKRVKTAKNYRDAVAAVRLAGYATSLDYVDNVIDLIEAHHLYVWDKNPKPVKLKDSKIQKEWNKKLKKLKEKNKKNKETTVTTTKNTTTTKVTQTTAKKAKNVTKTTISTTKSTVATTTKPNESTVLTQATANKFDDIKE